MCSPSVAGNYQSLENPSLKILHRSHTDSNIIFFPQEYDQSETQPSGIHLVANCSKALSTYSKMKAHLIPHGFQSSISLKIAGIVLSV